MAQGYALAQFNLGFMHEKGNGVKQDDAEAVKWYRLAAAQGFVEAQYNLGNMSCKGQGTEQDNTAGGGSFASCFRCRARLAAFVAACFNRALHSMQKPTPLTFFHCAVENFFFPLVPEQAAHVFGMLSKSLRITLNN